MTNLEALSMKIELEQLDCDLKVLELVGQIEKCVDEKELTKAIEFSKELEKFLERQKARSEEIKKEAMEAFMLDLGNLGE